MRVPLSACVHATDRGSRAQYGCEQCPWCLDWLRDEARARAIRAVVAAQWGVACAFLYPVGDPDQHFLFQLPATTDRGALLRPTAEQIVDGTA